MSSPQVSLFIFQGQTFPFPNPLVCTHGKANWFGYNNQAKTREI